MASLVTVPKASWSLNLAIVIVVISVLYFARSLLMPIALAILLSFVLSPVCRWLETFQIGRIPAVLVTSFMGFTILSVVVGLAIVELANISPKIPEYQRNLGEKFRSVNQYAEDFLLMFTEAAGGLGQNLSASQVSVPNGTLETPFAVRIVNSPISPMTLFEGVYESLAEILGSLAIVIVLVIFILVRREDLRDRFIYLIGSNRVTLTTQTMQDVGARVSRYLSTLFLFNLAFGISVGVGLHLIGIPSATLWGILAMFLRFIPYIGPWIAAAMPVVMSLAISTGWMAPLLTVLLFVFLELLNNNILEPWLYGKNTGISPIAVLMAAFFWMWLWGPIGLLLAMPLTVCLFVVGKHVPELSFLDILLGTEQVFEMKERIYQRILAGDQDRAVELFEECVQTTSIIMAFDTILIPVLARAETHWQLGELSEEKHKFILQSLRDFVQCRSEWFRELEAKNCKEKNETVDSIAPVAGVLSRSNSTIFCLPAQSEADEITALMLAQILEEDGCTVQAVSPSRLSLEFVDSLSQFSDGLICIAATPPTAIMHSRALVKLLHERVPKLPLIVGLWAADVDLGKASERIGYKVVVVRSLGDALTKIQMLKKTPSSVALKSLDPVLQH